MRNAPRDGHQYRPPHWANFPALDRRQKVGLKITKRFGSISSPSLTSPLYGPARKLSSAKLHVRTAEEILDSSEAVDKAIWDTHFGPRRRDENKDCNMRTAAVATPSLVALSPGPTQPAGLSRPVDSLHRGESPEDSKPGATNGLVEASASDPDTTIKSRKKNHEGELNSLILMRLSDLGVQFRIDKAENGPETFELEVRAPYSNPTSGKGSGLVALCKLPNGKDGPEAQKQNHDLLPHRDHSGEVKTAAYRLIACHLLAHPEGLAYVFDVYSGDDDQTGIEATYSNKTAPGVDPAFRPGMDLLGGNKNFDVGLLVDALVQEVARVNREPSENADAVIEGALDRIRVVRVFDIEGAYDALDEIEAECQLRWHRSSQEAERDRERAIMEKEEHQRRERSTESDVIVLSDEEDCDLEEDDDNDDDFGYSGVDEGPAVTGKRHQKDILELLGWKNGFERSNNSAEQNHLLPLPSPPPPPPPPPPPISLYFTTFPPRSDRAAVGERGEEVGQLGRRTNRTGNGGFWTSYTQQLHGFQSQPCPLRPASYPSPLPFLGASSASSVLSKSTGLSRLRPAGATDAPDRSTTNFASVPDDLPKAKTTRVIGPHIPDAAWEALAECKMLLHSLRRAARRVTGMVILECDPKLKGFETRVQTVAPEVPILGDGVIIQTDNKRTGEGSGSVTDTANIHKAEPGTSAAQTSEVENLEMRETAGNVYGKILAEDGEDLDDDGFDGWPNNTTLPTRSSPLLGTSDSSGLTANLRSSPCRSTFDDGKEESRIHIAVPASTSASGDEISSPTLEMTASVIEAVGTELTLPVVFPGVILDSDCEEEREESLETDQDVLDLAFVPGPNLSLDHDIETDAGLDNQTEDVEPEKMREEQVAEGESEREKGASPLKQVQGFGGAFCSSRHLLKTGANGDVRLSPGAEVHELSGNRPAVAGAATTTPQLQPLTDTSRLLSPEVWFRQMVRQLVVQYADEIVEL